jgi:hypothetical protein
MNVTFDRHLFTQIGLDSASLTMLGTVVHSFAQPGEYRCVVHEGAQVKAVFTLTADKASPAAQVSIDLTSLVSGPDPSSDQGPRRFVVNPRGYVLFHVSRGGGGYYVHTRRIDAAQEDKGYETRSLAEGDVFTAIVLRPGAYSVSNTLTGAKGELVVSYPKRGEKRYQPPAATRVVCSQRTFAPNKLEIDPGQGVIFEVRAPSRIVIKLEKPDDGPTRREPVPPRGRIPNRLPSTLGSGPR